MKTIPVIISIIVLALSGCAHTGYQRGYVGYSAGYPVQRHYDYDGYGRSYYSPGTSFIYERSYMQPRFSHQHHDHDYRHDHHRDWRPLMPPPHHFGDGHDRDRHRNIGREFMPSHRHHERSPNWDSQPHHKPPMSEPHRPSFGGHRGHGDTQHHGGHRGRAK